MKDDDLRQSLSALPTPPIDYAARDRGLH
ncbi:MAG: hypothetical protein K0R17_1510, partial [Rariglobus sp.]|nr:hypothetical protein [Rariglobus sp.]